MTGNEAQELAHRALRCGAVSAEASSGVVMISFEAIDPFFNEVAFASISIDSTGLSIKELRNSRTPSGLHWERKLAQVLACLEELHDSFKQLKAA